MTGTGPAPGGWGGNHGWPPASSPGHPPQYGWPPLPPPPAGPRRSRWPWIAAAVTACVVIVIGSAFFLRGSHDGGADHLSWDAGKDDGKVAGTYPSQPQPGWSVPLRNVTDLADYSWGYAADYGDVVLITAEPSYGSDDKSLLVALETASGRILWTTPSGIRGTFNCARETVDNLLMCVRDLTDESHGGAREVQFYRLDNGDLASTQTLPGLIDATVSDGAVFAAGYTSDNKNWVVRGTSTSLDAGWRVEFPRDGCSNDDSLYSTDSGPYVQFAGPLINTESGELASPDGTGASLSPNGQYLAIATPRDSCGEPSEWRITDTSGNTLWTDGPTQDSVSFGTAEDDGRIYFGPKAFDLATGNLEWIASSGITINGGVGSTLLGRNEGPTTEGSDDVTVGIDPATGVVKWQLDDTGYCFVNDGARCISDFYDGSKSVSAYNLDTGETDWAIEDVDEVSIAGPGFVTVDQDPGRGARVTYYPPPQ